MEEHEFHRKMAADLFNMVWSLLDKNDRTPADEQVMLNAAHASWYHWSIFGAPVNAVRGDWQISRVYSVLGCPEPALYHANRTLAGCQEHGIGDFDLAFAYEAMARANAVAGDRTERDRFYALAAEAGKAIAEEEDRTIFIQELKTVP